MVDEVADRVKDVFFRWERLRVVYNTALVLTFLVQGRAHLSLLLDSHRVLSLGYLAVVANVLFMAGPATEALVTWMVGRKVPVMRYSLLGIGLLLAVPLTSLATTVLFSPFD